MLDAFKDEISDEERAIQMGEAKPPETTATATVTEKPAQEEKGPETQTEEKPEEKKEEATAKTDETEQKTETEQHAEEMGLEVVTDEKSGKQYVVGEDGERIPVKRFAEVYRKAKDGDRAQEKLNLFKTLGPEGYYQAFPDERPAEQKQEPAKEAVPLDVDVSRLAVVYSEETPADQRPYEGMLLSEVWKEDPAFAHRLQTEFLLNQRQAAENRTRETERIRTEATKELEQFGASVAKELFSKEATALSKEEEAQVAGTIQQVIDWMNATKRGGGVIADAYFLMNKEGLIKKASKKAAEKVVKDLIDRKGPASIDTGGGAAPKADGWDAIGKMTPDQLSDHLDGLDDKAHTKFLREAPKSIREKFPSMPWKS